MIKLLNNLKGGDSMTKELIDQILEEIGLEKVDNTEEEPSQ
ncbi:hypothetical protein SAMN02745133_02066 [Desulforamulus putei DSM 12395]|uniref:Uncharacterized protein n=1 Tax=Desulforamulus putei DSM 12395 TaxID=1121429 RepID=A0A1M4ZRJ9_9FIRM|nr:hypothetical protein [Desulforamulus putei]SHF20196.1 hypothetical protein SAMN02745133_02066 [Desulforamulus putei DSM 12395]